METVSFDAAMLPRFPLVPWMRKITAASARHRHFLLQAKVWFAFVQQPRTLESYEKNFILGLGPDFTRGCEWSFGLTFPSPSGARGLKSRYIQSKKRKAVLQQFPFQIICLKTFVAWRLAKTSAAGYAVWDPLSPKKYSLVCWTRVSQHQTDAVDDGTENKKNTSGLNPRQATLSR